ncbi:ABC transporter ATP-binding protein [Candidatus Pseudoruminococcus sp.]|uniref:ABC transporter ATP-binding protein n=1 Tax=Candidatus Pseudoruminococcus sp. TaxID=3101048 RepID=UPI00399B3EA5
MAETSVKVDNVYMMFNLSKNKQTSLKQYFIDMVKGNLFFDEFWALENVSFELKKGESIGLVGVNGSGKSTLLRLIAGIMEPTHGTIYTKGTIAPLIALGGGFEPTLSARENIYLNGAMHGHSTNFMKKRFDDIITFAELEEFVDVPVKNFSSGMLARLGFAIATSVHADIVIADEVLSVGDARFRKKCETRISSLLKEGTTILYVSHNINSVIKTCQKALWLDKGRVIQNGNVREVCIAYKRYIEEQNRMAKEVQALKDEKA